MGDTNARLASLREQHRKLDMQIQDMQLHHADDAAIRTAKKIKLHIKEQMERLGHAGNRSN